MTPLQKAHLVQRSAITKAKGYLELAKDQPEDSQLYKAMLGAAIRELGRFTENDEYIDAMYDVDRRNDE